jgi:hypothetical protein
MDSFDGLELQASQLTFRRLLRFRVEFTPTLKCPNVNMSSLRKKCQFYADSRMAKCKNVDFTSSLKFLNAKKVEFMSTLKWPNVKMSSLR